MSYFTMLPFLWPLPTPMHIFTAVLLMSWPHLMDANEAIGVPGNVGEAMPHVSGASSSTTSNAIPGTVVTGWNLQSGEAQITSGVDLQVLADE
eukprot:2792628-Karenia_brevis.AAC.1